MAINDVEHLVSTDISGSIVLLYGDIASSPIAPKRYPFWNPEEHKRIISLLEGSSPKALICATRRSMNVSSGNAYTYVLFEDGDFDIPSVIIDDTVVPELLNYVGTEVELVSKAFRFPERAFNVVGRINFGDRSDVLYKPRIVITAHIDTKFGTYGALDNGTGVTVLLLLAELLSDYMGKYAIELVLFNGEDYYSAPGQVQ